MKLLPGPDSQHLRAAQSGLELGIHLDGAEDGGIAEIWLALSSWRRQDQERLARNDWPYSIFTPLTQLGPSKRNFPAHVW
jgi:hypothetical protein